MNTALKTVEYLTTNISGEGFNGPFCLSYITYSGNPA